MLKSEYLDMSKIVQSAKIKRLFDAVEEYGGTIRFVGGAVRDTLAGLSGFDLDLATDLSPDELVETCQNSGLKTIPIGLKIDTTGVVIDDRILEVASLRRNKDKHSGEVEFTDDWSADASQRDLTINAVYADLRGNVFDYYDGINDLEKGIVRFIGNPEEKIRQDYLRILRFFRFYSRFGKADIDEEGLKACIKLKDGLRTVAIERVRDELFKLLITPNVAKVMKIIFDNDILAYFLPRSEHLGALNRLTKIVSDANYEGDFLRRLFVLYQPNSAKAENMANSLHFTKKQKEIFVRWAKIEASEENLSTPRSRLNYIYRYGKQFCINKILLSCAINKINLQNLPEILREIENTVVPVFPVRGRDIINKGIPQDKVGKTLDYLERKWMDSNYTLTREEILNLL